MGLVDCGGNFLKLEMGHVDFSFSNAENPKTQLIRELRKQLYLFLVFTSEAVEQYLQFCCVLTAGSVSKLIIIEQNNKFKQLDFCILVYLNIYL